MFFGRGSLRSQRDQMLIDHDDPDKLSSLGAKHLAAEEHISLLWSEAVLFSDVSINIFAALRRGRDLFRTLEKPH
jgi:hypothetical protein